MTLLRFAVIALLAFQQQTDAPPMRLSVNVQMVEVYASVYDAKGDRVENLHKSDFRIIEEGVPQTVDLFESQTSGANVALLIDTTSSMEPLLPRVKAAATELIGKLGPEDKVGLFTFNTALKTVEPFTNDRKTVVSSLLKLRAGGGTALYDALAQLARDLSGTGGKKAIILFTDGMDNNSVLGLTNATAIIRRIGVPVYGIAQGGLLDDSPGLRRLKEIAKDTNGIAFEARTDGALRNVLVKINDDLQHLYLLGYYSSNTDSTSNWRQISLTLPGHPKLRVRAKEGYTP